MKSISNIKKNFGRNNSNCYQITNLAAHNKTTDI